MYDGTAIELLSCYWQAPAVLPRLIFNNVRTGCGKTNKPPRRHYKSLTLWPLGSILLLIKVNRRNRRNTCFEGKPSISFKYISVKNISKIQENSPHPIVHCPGCSVFQGTLQNLHQNSIFGKREHSGRKRAALEMWPNCHLVLDSLLESIRKK